MKFNYRRDRKQLIQNFNYKLPDHKSVKFLNSFSSGKKFFFIYNEFNSEEDYSTRIGQICQSDIFEPQLLKNKHQQSQNRISSTVTPKTFIKSRFTCNSSTRPAKIISIDLSNNKIFSLFTSNNSVFICSYGIDQINLLFSEKKLVSLLSGGKISSERRKLLGDCDFKSLRSNPILPKPQNHENLSMFSVNQKTAVTDQNFNKNNLSEMNSMNKTISAKNQIPKTTNPLDQQLIENKILGNLIFINDLNSYSSQISSFSGRIIGNYNEIILGFNNGSFITYTTPTELFKSGSVSSDNFKIFQGNSSIHSNKFRDMKIDKIATSSNSELNIFRNSDHSLQAVSQPTANCSFAKSKNCCQALKSPYCSWNLQKGFCQTGKIDNYFAPKDSLDFTYNLENSFYQCEKTGNISKDLPLLFRNNNKNSVLSNYPDGIYIEHNSSYYSKKNLSPALFQIFSSWSDFNDSYLDTTLGKSIFFLIIFFIIVLIIFSLYSCMKLSLRYRKLRRDAADLHNNADEVHKLVSELNNNYQSSPLTNGHGINPVEITNSPKYYLEEEAKLLHDNYLKREAQIMNMDDEDQLMSGNEMQEEPNTSKCIDLNDMMATNLNDSYKTTTLPLPKRLKRQNLQLNLNASANNTARNYNKRRNYSHTYSTNNSNVNFENVNSFGTLPLRPSTASPNFLATPLELQLEKLANTLEKTKKLAANNKTRLSPFSSLKSLTKRRNQSTKEVVLLTQQGPIVPRPGSNLEDSNNTNSTLLDYNCQSLDGLILRNGRYLPHTSLYNRQNHANNTSYKNAQISFPADAPRQTNPNQSYQMQINSINIYNNSNNNSPIRHFNTFGLNSPSESITSPVASPRTNSGGNYFNFPKSEKECGLSGNSTKVTYRNSQNLNLNGALKMKIRPNSSPMPMSRAVEEESKSPAHVKSETSLLSDTLIYPFSPILRQNGGFLEEIDRAAKDVDTVEIMKKNACDDHDNLSTTSSLAEQTKPNIDVSPIINKVSPIKLENPIIMKKHIDHKHAAMSTTTVPTTDLQYQMDSSLEGTPVALPRLNLSKESEYQMNLSAGLGKFGNGVVQKSLYGYSNNGKRKNFPRMGAAANVKYKV